MSRFPWRRWVPARTWGERCADAARVVRELGLANRIDAMFNSIEGEWGEVMDVVRQAATDVEPQVSQYEQSLTPGQ